MMWKVIASQENVEKKKILDGLKECIEHWFGKEEKKKKKKKKKIKTKGRGGNGEDDEEEETIRRCFVDVCSYAVAGNLSIDEILETMETATENCGCALIIDESGSGNEVDEEERISASSSLRSILVDAIWLLGNQLENADIVDDDGLPAHKASEEWRRLSKFVERLTKEKGWVRESTLKDRLSLDLLDSADVISFKDFRKRLVKVSTKQKYTQEKYNLLREDTEGYAKLLTLLTQKCNRTTGAVSIVADDIRSLVGQFKLDPNRVFDLIVEVFERHCCADGGGEEKEINKDNNNDGDGANVFIGLLKTFQSTHVVHQLGFKFQQYASLEKEAPESLYRATAHLVHAGVVDLDALWTHLSPQDDAMKKVVAERRITLKKVVRKIGSINLNQSDDGSDRGDLSSQWTWIYNALPSSDEGGPCHDPMNQKLRVVAALVSAGAWSVVSDAIARLKVGAGVSRVAILDPNIRRAMLELLWVIVAPLYREVTGFDRVSSDRKASASLRFLSPIDSIVRLGTSLLPIVSELGVLVGTDAQLFVRLCRLVKAAYKNSEVLESDAERSALERVLCRVLVPSVSFLGPNPAAAAELWSVLKDLPYSTRYKMYASWKMGDYEMGNEAIVTRIERLALKATKSALKQLTTESQRPVGRKLAKIAHSSPLILLDHIVSRVESYENMIRPVVDAFKFLGPLSLDMLSFVTLDHVASDRSRLQSDGSNVSKWLKSLATFSGLFYRKFFHVELKGMLQFIVSRLKLDQSLELCVFAELIKEMAGIGTFQELTGDGAKALSGGRILRRESSTIEKSAYNKRSKKASEHLLRVLVKEENFALPFLVLMAQQKYAIVFKTESEQLKLVSNLHDMCQNTFIQVFEFLSSNMTPSEYARALPLPSLATLCKKYRLQHVEAFHMCRPVMRQVLIERWSGTRNGSKGTSSSIASKWDPLAPKFLDTVRDLMNGGFSSSHDGDGDGDDLDALTECLFTIFWSLSVEDLEVPTMQYKSVIDANRRAIESLQKSWAANGAAAGGGGVDRATSKKIKKLEEIQRALRLEQKQRKTNVETVARALEKTSVNLFASADKSLMPKICPQFLQSCIFPRALFTPADARYCAKFIETLHKLNTPHFSTLHFFSKTISQLPSTILCVTEIEAKNLGVFLCDVLELLHSWYVSKTRYDEQCKTKVGFRMKFEAIASDTSDSQATYGQYSKVFRKWHDRLAKLLSSCLASTEYMHIRNALTVLQKISGVFPVTQTACDMLQRNVDKIKESEFEDLRIMSQGYLRALKNRREASVPDFSGVVRRNNTSRDAAPPAQSKTGAQNISMNGASGGKGGREIVGKSVGRSSSRRQSFSDSASQRKSKLPPSSSSSPPPPSTTSRRGGKRDYGGKSSGGRGGGGGGREGSANFSSSSGSSSSNKGNKLGRTNGKGFESGGGRASSTSRARSQRNESSKKRGPPAPLRDTSSSDSKKKAKVDDRLG
eukprot:g1797.t1